jgi:hypothetical protein
MDRVLLIIDDIQYSRHVEMTLRKVGFELETVNNEFGVNEAVLSFNPDYIVVRGSGTRLSTLGIGKKLKESHSKYVGKVILIFGEKYDLAPEDLIKLRMDLMLLEPLSTLRLAVHLFSFSGGDIEFIKDKLLKFAITDSQFRSYEQIILRNAGLTIDSEIQMVSDMNQLPAVQVVKSGSPAAQSQNEKPEEKPVYITQEEIKKIHEELKALEHELPLRIDTYNRLIKKVDQDLSKGLKKRQTKQVSSQLRKDLIKEQKTDIKSENELDEERISFTKALFKKS